MRARTEASSEAQGAFSGIRTILVPPDIVAVPRRSPAPVKKRTPWRPQPDGQARTERSGAREWFSDKLFVENADGHPRSSFSASAAIHVCGAVLIAASVVVQTVHSPVVHARSSLVMPAMVSAAPAIDVAIGAPEPRRKAASHEMAAAPVAQPAAAEPPAPLEAPASIEPETGAERSGEDVASAGDTAGGGIDAAAPDSTGSGSGAGGPAISGPYRVGADSGIKLPRKIRDVKPVFPMRALTDRAHGSVIIEATIGEDGRVRKAAVVHSVPTLDQAAIDAVRQWEYTPSMMNGVAVAVVMLVVVTFTIQ